MESEGGGTLAQGAYERDDDFEDSQSPEPLNERVRELLSQRGISQAELCARAGIQPSFLSRFMKGKRRFSLENVHRVSSALDLTPAELVRGTDAAELVQAVADMVPRTDFEALAEKLATVSAEAQKVQAEALSLQAGNAALTEQLQEALDGKHQAERRLEALKVEHDALKVLHQEAEDRGRSLSEGLERAHRSVEELQTRARRSAQQLADARNEVATVRAQLQEAQLALETLAKNKDEQLRLKIEELERSERAKDQASLSLKNSVAECKALREESAQQQSELLLEKSKVRKLNQEVSVLHASLEQVNRQVTINFERWRQAAATVEQLKAQLQQEVSKANERAVIGSLLSGLAGLGLGVVATKVATSSDDDDE